MAHTNTNQGETFWLTLIKADYHFQSAKLVKVIVFCETCSQQVLLTYNI